MGNELLPCGLMEWEASEILMRDVRPLWVVFVSALDFIQGLGRWNAARWRRPTASS